MLRPGRPSKLDDRTKAEVLRRLALGEKPSVLRKAYNLSETTFRRNFSAGVSKVQEVGAALATAELALAELPVSAQVSARSLADQLKGLSEGLVKTAALNGKTAAILAERGHKAAQELPDGAGVEDLRVVAAYTETSNKASSLGVSLMQANKDSGKDQGRPTLEDLITGGK